MQVQVEIQFDDLLKIIKNLPASQLSILKQEIEQKEPNQDTSRQHFKDLLLSGPTFSKKQLETIAKTRKAINQWRTK